MVEISRAVSKYNAAVFVLNGGSTTKALTIYGYSVGGSTLKIMCRDANPEHYKKIRETEENRSWYSETNNKWYYNDVSLSILRQNKKFFIGELDDA